MKKISIMDTVKLSGPHPFAMLVSQKPNGKLNVMGVSWYSFVSLAPPKMLVCLGSQSFSGEMVRATGVFTLCLPTEKIADEAMRCCGSSGRDTDKVEALGLDMVLPEGFDVHAIADAKIAWALKLEAAIPLGDHTLYIADIAAAAQFSHDPQLLAFEGYTQLKPIDPR